MLLGGYAVGKGYAIDLCIGDYGTITGFAYIRGRETLNFYQSALRHFRNETKPDFLGM